MKKRIISLLLAVVMLFSCMSVSIFAANEGGEAQAEEATVTEYDNGALDALVEKQTGSLYEWSDWTLGENDVLWTDGYWKSEAGKLFATFVNNKDAKTNIEYLTGRNTATTGNNEIKSSDGEAQFIDVVKPATWNNGNPDITVSYVPGFYELTDAKYVVFSMEFKRGEAMANTNFLRMRCCGDKNNSGSTTAEKYFAVNDGGKLKLNDVIAGDFSTDLYTTITAVYDKVNNKMTLYANGNKVGNEFTPFDDTSKTVYLRDFSWWYGNNACQGRIFSIRNVRCAILNNDTNLSACVNANTNLANGVFKIDGDYYLFEKAFPVTGATRTVDGYTIVTEANTGKIVKCYKANTSVYERWTADEYTANGVTLDKNGYKNDSGYGNDKTGYRLIKTITDDDGVEYYILTQNTPKVPEKTDKDQFVTKDLGDGFEFTQKLNGGVIVTYKSLPVEITDENKADYEYTEGGTAYYKIPKAEFDKVIRQETDSKTNQTKDITFDNDNKQTTALDVSSYFGIAGKTVKSTDSNTRGNVNFRLKAGTANMEVGDAVRFRFYYNSGNTDSGYRTLGKIKRNASDGLLHLYMSDFDCGILRTDAYTDITISTYLTDIDGDSDTDLVYDLYVNGVLKKSAIVLQNDVTQYKYNVIGTYIGNNTYYDKPFLTWGKTQVYYGDKVNNYNADNAEVGYTGTVTGANGTYTYTNGIATAFEAGKTAEGTAVLNGYSVTLGEKLGMNFYATLNGSGAKTAVITVGDKQQVISLDRLTAGEDGKYKISSSVSSINVNEQIKIAFYDADGKLVNIVTADGVYEGIYITSVKAYAETLLKTSTDEKEKAVLTAMLTYAAYAEKNFCGNGAFDTLNAQTDRAAVTAVTAEDIIGTLKAGATEGGDLGILGDVQLVLDNATKVRVYLNKAATVTSESANVRYVDKDGEYYVEISNIDAKNLDTVYTFTVNGNVTVEISALGVAKHVVAKSDDDNLKNLMKALSLYSAAVEAYSTEA